MSQPAHEASENRKVQYRHLLDQVSELQEAEQTGPDITDRLIEIIEQTNALFSESTANKNLPTSEECLLDAKVVTTVSDVLVYVAEAVDCSIDSYNYLDFAKKIRSKYVSDNYGENDDDQSEMDYKKLFPLVNRLIKRVPNYVSYYGPTGIVTATPTETKIPKERKLHKRNEQAGNKKSPEKITQTDKEEASVDDTVKFLMWSLNKAYEEMGRESISYFQFVLNPNCFTTTVENIFHVSFLVRDGRAKIERDDDGNLLISPIHSKVAKKGDVPNKQSIVSIDMSQWEELCEVLNVEEAFLDSWKVLWEEKRQQK